MAASLTINPGGVATVVTINGGSIPVFTDATLNNRKNMPATITTPTTFWVADDGAYVVLVTQGGAQQFGSGTVRLGASSPVTVAVPASSGVAAVRTPTDPTAPPLTNSTQVATTAYADAAVAAAVRSQTPIGDGIFWDGLNASPGIFPLPGPTSSTGSEVRTLIDGVAATAYYGLHHAVMAKAGTVWANGTVVAQDTILMVQRNGPNEGSSPYSQGNIYFATCAGGPGGTVSTPIEVYAAPANDDARQPGVAIRADGVISVVIGVRLDTAATFITNGTVVVYSFDGGLTWTTPTTSDQPNAVLSANYQELCGIGGLTDLGFGTTYAALGQTATVGVVLCPWQGYAVSGDTFQSAGYYIGTYTAGSHVTWTNSVKVINGQAGSINWAEIVIIVTSATNWLAFIRNNGSSAEYQSVSANAGTTWSAPALLAAFGANDQPSLCYGGFHPTLAPNGMILAMGRLNIAAYSTTRPGIIYSDNAGTSWHGPFEIENRGGTNNFDYGSITIPPSRPGELWLTYAEANNSYPGTANILGRCGGYGFYVGTDVLGGLHSNGIQTRGNVEIFDGILRMNNGSKSNGFLGWVPSLPASSWGGANVGDFCLLTAPVITGTKLIIGYLYTAITVWTPMYVATGLPGVVLASSTHSTGYDERTICTAGTFTDTLPAPAANGECWVTNQGTGVITVTPPSGSLFSISGASGNLSLSQGQGFHFVSNGTNWYASA